MTTSTPKKPARAPKPQGQWALGETEPLNDNERLKGEDNPLNVRERIETIYSKEGFESIPKEDLRGRFRWYGLYTQRTQGYDGTYTGDDNIDLLEADRFMLRVRSDGGRLTPQQLRVIAEISEQFAENTADLSDRQNVQLHWIRVEDMPEIWRRLEEVGLGTTEACGDCPRVILNSPLAGRSQDEVLDPTPAVDEILRRYLGDPEYSNLPRKFKSAISGLQDVVHEINDVAFVGVHHPEHGPGLDVWVGGGLSTNPMLGQRLGAWVPLDEVPDVWEAILRLYRDYGYRRLRTKARIKFLVKDWGIDKFRDILETEFLKRPLIDGPAPQQLAHPIDHSGVQEQKDGLFAIGGSPIAGRLSGTALKAIADAVEAAGSQDIRLTPHQKIVALDIPQDSVESIEKVFSDNGANTRPSLWRRNLIACSGIEFCKLSFTETRKRAQTLVPDLDQRLADLNDELGTSITININGCPNSCARAQIADIGFKGQIVKDDEGNSVEGFQIHLGGSLGLDSGFGRKLRGHKVLGTEVADYIERVVRAYAAGRTEGERFAQWAVRAEEDVLQ